MKTPFEALLENQRKIMDFWSEAGKNINPTWSGSATQTSPPEFLQTWFDNSKKLWDEASKMTKLGSPVGNQSDQFMNWAKLQKEFADFWLKYSGDHLTKMNTGANGFNQPFGNMNPLSNLQEWVEKSQQWVDKTILQSIPSSQQPHMKNFKEAYDQMYQHWEPILKMIRSNMHDRHQLNEWFGKNDYVPMISKFMGFQAISDPEALQTQMQDSFRRYGEWLEKHPIGQMDWTEQIKKFNNLLVEAEGSPYKYIYELNQVISESLDSYLSVSGQGKDVEIMKLMKEIQFAYFAFVTKLTEMQHQVYESSYKALPESLSHFSAKYQEDKALPDYQEFFKHFVNTLEKHVTETFSSKGYSTLQSTVAKNASNVKSLSEKLIELAVVDLPFLTNSFADEVALENQTLRKKIRELERRLEKLEEVPKLEKLEEVPKAVKPKPAPRRRRAKPDEKKTASVV